MVAPVRVAAAWRGRNLYLLMELNLIIGETCIVALCYVCKLEFSGKCCCEADSEGDGRETEETHGDDGIKFCWT